MSEGLAWQADVDPAVTAFFLDVDGTLLGLKDKPEEVVADEDLRHLLAALASASDGALALVSGRQIDDLDRIMAPLVLAAGGTHGAEMRWPDGRREAMEAASLDEIRLLAEDFVTSRDGLRLEDKGAAIAIHYRGAPMRQRDVAAFLIEAVGDRDLMIQHGKMVAEVKSSRSSKGGAIETFMQSPPFAGRRPLFIGDDLTDEHGFASVNKLGGMAVKVGDASDETVARYRLADVADVRAFLQSILKVL